jgi:hypothetical protein
MWRAVTIPRAEGPPVNPMTVLPVGFNSLRFRFHLRVQLHHRQPSHSALADGVPLMRAFPIVDLDTQRG